MYKGTGGFRNQNVFVLLAQSVSLYIYRVEDMVREKEGRNPIVNGSHVQLKSRLFFLMVQIKKIKYYMIKFVF